MNMATMVTAAPAVRVSARMPRRDSAKIPAPLPGALRLRRSPSMQGTLAKYVTPPTLASSPAGPAGWGRRAARKARKAHDEDSEADDDSDGLQTVTCADINRAADILREIPHVEDVLVAPKVYRGVASAFVHEEADGNANRSVNQFLLEPVAPFL